MTSDERLSTIAVQVTRDADRFRLLVERIASWTDAELTVVDARQTRHVAQTVLNGACPSYPPFGPVEETPSERQA